MQSCSTNTSFSAELLKSQEGFTTCDLSVSWEDNWDGYIDQYEPDEFDEYEEYEPDELEEYEPDELEEYEPDELYEIDLDILHEYGPDELYEDELDILYEYEHDDRYEYEIIYGGNEPWDSPDEEDLVAVLDALYIDY